MAESCKVIAALIRHGDYQQLPDTPSAHQPFPLSDVGIEQARTCAARLITDIAQNGWSLDPSIDSSKLLRAWQTASLISQTLRQRGQANCCIAEFDDLAERSLGIAGNLSLTQINDVIAADPRCDPLPTDWKINSDFRLPVPGAESLIDAGARVAAHVRARIAASAERKGDTVLKVFVGHGAAIRHAAFHLGIIDRDDIARLSMHHARPIYVATQGGTWQHIGGTWKKRQAPVEAPD